MNESCLRCGELLSSWDNSERTCMRVCVSSSAPSSFGWARRASWLRQHLPGYLPLGCSFIFNPNQIALATVLFVIDALHVRSRQWWCEQKVFFCCCFHWSATLNIYQYSNDYGYMLLLSNKTNQNNKFAFGVFLRHTFSSSLLSRFALSLCVRVFFPLQMKLHGIYCAHSLVFVCPMATHFQRNGINWSKNEAIWC